MMPPSSSSVIFWKVIVLGGVDACSILFTRTVGLSILIHTFLGSDWRRHLRSLQLFNTYIVSSPRATTPNICSVDMPYSFSEFMRRSNCRVLICVCNVSRLVLYQLKL